MIRKAVFTIIVAMTLSAGMEAFAAPKWIRDLPITEEQKEELDVMHKRLCRTSGYMAKAAAARAPLKGLKEGSPEYKKVYSEDVKKRLEAIQKPLRDQVRAYAQEQGYYIPGTDEFGFRTHPAEMVYRAHKSAANALKDDPKFAEFLAEIDRNYQAVNAVYEKYINLSEADKKTVSGMQGPSGSGFTYPHMATDLNGKLYHRSRIHRKGTWKAVGLSSLDVATQTWSMLGADVPDADGGVKGRPMTLWEDNAEATGHTYSKPSVNLAFDFNNRLHLCFSVLNRTPAKYKVTSQHSVSDILYAWSDDGGKTIFKSDGSPIQWPVRAEAGPHQAEVVCSDSEGEYPWLGGGSIVTDWKNRPIVAYSSKKTGRYMVHLQNGKWVDYGDLAKTDELGIIGRDNAGVLTARLGENEILRFWDPEHLRRVALPYAIKKLDSDHLRDTGEMIYTVQGDENEKITLVRTTIQRPI